MNWHAIYRYRFPRAKLVGSVGSDSEFEELVSKVVSFIEAPALGLDLPLDIRGTAVQQQVWQALMEIPAGETASYTEIAARIGAPKSSACGGIWVAYACALNPIAVAIPCPRAVRNDGTFSVGCGT